MTEQSRAAPHCRVCWQRQDRGGVTSGQSMGQHPPVFPNPSFPSENVDISFIVYLLEHPDLCFVFQNNSWT